VIEIESEDAGFEVLTAVLMKSTTYLLGYNAV
jgi:hypothetical protein